MFSKSVLVSSLLFLAGSGVNAAPLKRECMDDPAACFSRGAGHMSSIFSHGSVWASTQTVVSSALSEASSDASSLASSVSSLVHAGPTVTPVPVRRECMDDPAACFSRGAGHMSSIFSHGSVWASTQTVVSSALSEASSDASSLASSVSSLVHAGPTATPVPVRRDCMDDPANCFSRGLNDASSVFSDGSVWVNTQTVVSSALSEASSDASSLWSRVINGPNGAQATGLVEYVTVNNNGQTLTEVSSSGGPVITLAPSGHGTPTTFGGVVFTVATGDVLAAQPSGNNGNTGSANNHNAGFHAGVPTAFLGLVTFIGALLAL